MPILNPKRPFMPAPVTDISDVIGNFSIVPWMFEADITARTGFELTDESIDQIPAGVYGQFEDILPMHYERWSDEFYKSYEKLMKKNSKKLQKVVERFFDIESPCAMIIRSEQELARHISIAYQVAYANYIIGKTKKYKKGKFPIDCCGISGRNVMKALLAFNYPNAIYVYNEKQDHGYTALPFVIEKTKKPGAIVIDPTSDQVWEETAKEKRPRNTIFVSFGKSWEYKAEGDFRGNMFPTLVLSINEMRKHNEYNRLDLLTLHGLRGRAYLKQAFSNPVEIQPKPLID